MLALPRHMLVLAMDMNEHDELGRSIYGFLSVQAP